MFSAFHWALYRRDNVCAVNCKVCYVFPFFCIRTNLPSQVDDGIIDVCFKIWLLIGHVLELWPVLHLGRLNYPVIHCNTLTTRAVVWS